MINVPAIPGLTPAELALVRKLAEVISARTGHNTFRDRLYEGKHAVRLLGLAGADRYSATAAIIGWPSKTVDLMAARTVVSSIESAKADELGLAKVLRDNDFTAEIAGAINGMFLHGVSFLVSSGGRVGEPRGLLHVVDASSGTGTWNARTRRLDDFLSIYRTGELGMLEWFTLYVPGQAITAELVKGGEWKISRTGKHSDVPVEVLRHRYRHGTRPFGRSRITRPVIGLTEAAMRVAIRMEGHADLYSMPGLILLGATPDDLTDGGGAAWINTLGNVLGLNDDPDPQGGAPARGDVRQITASSPKPHIDQLRQYAQLFSGETAIPVSSLGISDFANPAGADSYLASREDLIGEAETVADSLTGPISRAVARTVAYANGLSAAPDEWDFHVRWRNAAHVSLAARADAGAKQLGALPWLAETPLGPELAGLTESQVASALQYQQRAQATSLVDRILAAQDGGPDAGD